MEFVRKAGAVSLALIACCAAACSVETSPEQSMDESADSDTAAASADVCWKRTTTRGAGTIPSECPNAEKSGALCYPLCAAGYTGVGPVCWQSCPAGYTDDGAFCRRDVHIMSANNSGCPWYDKCGLTFSKGCSTCPPGYVNDGCTCRRDAHIFAKSTKPRGAGWPMSCPAGTENDAGLCYPRCGEGSKGAGPVCWAHCAGDLSIECGAGCARSSDACAEATSNQALESMEAVASLVMKDFAGAVEAGVAAANEFNLPLCNQP